jgi:DNA-binding NarL/FixJ family response regulator
VLVVTMFDDDQHVLDSIEAGAAGYLLKDALPEGIVASVRDLRWRRLAHQPRHRAPHPRSLPPRDGTGARAAPRRRPRAGSPLTERETELLRLTAKGLSFDTISELMGISPHTVVAHVRKIYRKLAVHSAAKPCTRPPSWGCCDACAADRPHLAAGAGLLAGHVVRSASGGAGATGRTAW